MNVYPAGIDVEMHTFIQLVRRNALAAVVIGAALAAAVYFGSQRLPERFEATATLSIAPAEAGGGVAGVAFSAPRTDSSAYVIVAESQTAIAEALSRTDLTPIDTAAVKDAANGLRVSVSRGNDADLVNVTATGESPESAAGMANAMADVLIEWDRQRAESLLENAISALEATLGAEAGVVIGAAEEAARTQQFERYQALLALRGSATSSASYVSRAVPPLEPSFPRPLFFAVVAFITAFVAVLAAAVIRPAVADRFTTGLEAADYLEAPVVGEYLRRRTTEVDSKALRDAAAYTAANLIRTESTGMAGHVVTVASPRRSEQGPSFALGLAVAFADLGKRTVFIDSDLRNPVSFMNLPRKEKGVATLGEALRRGTSSFRPATLKKGITRLDIIQASVESDDATVLLARGMPGLIASISARYEFIVVNTTPLLEAADALSFIANSDDVIFLLDAEAVSRQDALVAARLIRNRRSEDFSIVYTSKARTSGRGRASRRRTKATRTQLGGWDVAPEKGTGLSDRSATERIGEAPKTPQTVVTKT